MHGFFCAQRRWRHGFTVGDVVAHVLEAPGLGVPQLPLPLFHAKPVEPLTAGRIQLQSEGAETYFRNLTIEPIDHLPQIHAE